MRDGSKNRFPSVSGTWGMVDIKANEEYLGAAGLRHGTLRRRINEARARDANNYLFASRKTTVPSFLFTSALLAKEPRKEPAR